MYAMKCISFIILLLISCRINATPADPADSVGNGDITQSVAAVLRSGDAAALAAYFSATIDLTMPGSEGTYSKAQAELIIKGFFNANVPSDFIINHQGSSGEGSQFCIGSLKTSTMNFRVYFLIKTVNGVSLIIQMQFEEE
jgi:hypothetical protein